MNITETLLRVIVTFLLVAPRLEHIYYLNKLTTMGSMLLIMFIGLFLFFYEIVQLYKGIREKAYGGIYILEISLLLFVAAIYGSLTSAMILAFISAIIKIPFMKQLSFGAENIFYCSRNTGIIAPVLIGHYGLWLYRIFTTKKHSIR